MNEETKTGEIIQYCPGLILGFNGDVYDPKYFCSLTLRECVCIGKDSIDDIETVGLISRCPSNENREKISQLIESYSEEKIR